MKLYDTYKVVIVTGGFDPLHSGHLAYLHAAKELGGTLVVGLNSDQWLTRKKGKPFLPYSERERVLSSLKVVDSVIDFNDSNGNAADAIVKTQHKYPRAEIIFANGGDQTSKTIPEIELFRNTAVRFEFNVGGSKVNSSTDILNQWQGTHVERPWGYYRVLHNELGIVKVKELVVMPGKQLSMQKHYHRAEHWFITKGTATVYTIDKDFSNLAGLTYELLGEFNKFDKVHINKGEWHQLSNQTQSPLKIVEIQYGESCSEDDIERKSEKDST